MHDLNLLSTYAQDNPQAAYSALTKDMSSRWIHFQGTILHMSELFEPLENIIKFLLL